MENMELYLKLGSTPLEARRKIESGRLKGFTDVNPMYRIKALTEVFGPCGYGWKPEIVSQRLEKGKGAEVAAFVDINLYVKVDGKWSEPIPGIGGSMFISEERNGPRTSDEAFKMAYTDALSVACKALGMCADVYYEKDQTKYTKCVTDGDGESRKRKLDSGASRNSNAEVGREPCICSGCGSKIVSVSVKGGRTYSAEELTANSMRDFKVPLCYHCLAKAYRTALESKKSAEN